MTENIIIIIVSYLLGTIPTALIIVKYTTGNDIRSIGTGNIGAMNSYESTGKKWIGFLVFILDALKGSAAVLIARLITGNDIIAVSLAVLFSVFGHNFNIFLKIKGGRGLATATGAIILVNPLILILWIVMYITGFYVIKKNINVASVTGTIGATVLLFSSPDNLIFLFSMTGYQDLTDIKIMCTLLCIIICLKHIKPIKELLLKSD